MEILKKIRKSQGLTQVQLAQRAGLDQATISKLERGELNVTMETLNHIADALGVKTYELISQDEIIHLVIREMEKRPDLRRQILAVVQAMTAEPPQESE